MSEVRHLWRCGTLRRGPFSIFNLNRKKKTTNSFSIHYLFAVNLTFSRLLRRHAWIFDSSRCAFGLTRTIRRSGNVGCFSQGNVVGQKKTVQKTIHWEIALLLFLLLYYFIISHAIICRRDKSNARRARTKSCIFIFVTMIIIVGKYIYIFIWDWGEVFLPVV